MLNIIAPYNKSLRAIINIAQKLPNLERTLQKKSLFEFEDRKIQKNGYSTNGAITILSYSAENIVWYPLMLFKNWRNYFFCKWKS